MNVQTIKAFIVFILIAAVFFFVANNFARESNFSIVEGAQSAKFLDLVAKLDSIEFDFDFINLLGTTSLMTDVFVRDPLATETGRVNPFMKSGSRIQSAGSRTPVSDFSSFDRTEEFQGVSEQGGFIENTDNQGAPSDFYESFFGAEVEGVDPSSLDEDFDQTIEDPALFSGEQEAEDVRSQQEPAPEEPAPAQSAVLTR